MVIKDKIYKNDFFIINISQTKLQARINISLSYNIFIIISNFQIKNILYNYIFGKRNYNNSIFHASTNFSNVQVAFAGDVDGKHIAFLLILFKMYLL